METPRKPLNKYWCSVPHYLSDIRNIYIKADRFPLMMADADTQALVSFKKYMPPPLPYLSTLFPFPTSPQYFSLICDPFEDLIISLHSRDISLFDCHI